MSLFIGLGSNLGDKKNYLIEAKKNLSKHFKYISESQIYVSEAVDYLNQPDFFNQVLEFAMPDISPLEVMDILLKIELDMGRQRDIPKGPRVIDLDLLFYGTETFNSLKLTIPHPRLFERSFVVLPLRELPGFEKIKNQFSFSWQFSNTSNPLQ